ncbi:Hpt domain-containing protein [Massilia sp. W12]|uniref:Hpt domain-containing protein n=1 Tax=Massilia sp. W12 TaxID=3126507 RepID=UPI0030D10599
MDVSTVTYQHCDPTQLLETVGFDREIFTEWVTMFLSESVSQFEQVKQAALAGDAKQLEFEAHALKGSVGNTGAQKLYETLYAIELEGHAGKCECPPQRIQEVEDLLMEVRKEMQHYMEHGEFPEG